jgi:hypothetical protein
MVSWMAKASQTSQKKNRWAINNEPNRNKKIVNDIQKRYLKANSSEQPSFLCVLQFHFWPHFITALSSHYVSAIKKIQTE